VNALFPIYCQRRGISRQARSVGRDAAQLIKKGGRRTKGTAVAIIRWPSLRLLLSPVTEAQNNSRLGADRSWRKEWPCVQGEIGFNCYKVCLNLIINAIEANARRRQKDDESCHQHFVNERGWRVSRGGEIKVPGLAPRLLSVLFAGILHHETERFGGLGLSIWAVPNYRKPHKTDNVGRGA